MPIDDMVKDIAARFLDEAKKAPDELEKLVKADLTAFLTGVSGPALDLGVTQVKALLFGEAVQLMDLQADLTDDQLAALTDEESLRRETVLAAHAQQMALIAQAEATKQVAAAQVRAKAKAFLGGLLSKAGKIGLGILTSGLIAV